jgi:shikimate 5-dehydrogenase
MDLGLEGRCALVLGAGGGRGAAIAIALAREGARVAVAGRTEDKLRRTVGTRPPRSASVSGRRGSGAAAFLASDRASGSVLRVDGGLIGAA